MRTFSNANFFHSQISRYKPNTPRTSSRTSICLRTLAYEPFAKRTFPLRALAYEPLLSELFEFEAYPMWTFYIMDFCRYELFTIRTLSHTNICVRTFASETMYSYANLMFTNFSPGSTGHISAPSTYKHHYWTPGSLYHCPTDHLSAHLMWSLPHRRPKPVPWWPPYNAARHLLGLIILNIVFFSFCLNLPKWTTLCHPIFQELRHF